MMKVIVFDFDGVLVESVDVKTKAFAELFKGESSEIIEKMVEYHLENGGISRFEKFRYYYKYLLKRPLSEENEKELGERFSRIVMKKVIEAPWVAGAKETLDYFYNKLPLYVASGTPDRELKQIITARKMDHYFQDIFGAPEQKSSILRKIIDITKTKPDHVIMVGDAMSDYQASKEVGVRFIGRIKPGGNPFAGENIQTVLNLINIKRQVAATTIRHEKPT